MSRPNANAIIDQAPALVAILVEAKNALESPGTGFPFDGENCAREAAIRTLTRQIDVCS